VIVQQIGNAISHASRQGCHHPALRTEFPLSATAADRHYVVEHGRVIDMIPDAALDANRQQLKTDLGV
jgi:branched-chain amino acid transport system ATP-binding protein